mmetsp:Transcript_1386/g.2412  ORF Transcript_1386/g.2412 Transcript_1386/m.2412 type:complete len:347 (-) Transcript_1386:865-1905(-)
MVWDAVGDNVSGVVVTGWSVGGKVSTSTGGSVGGQVMLKGLGVGADVTGIAVGFGVGSGVGSGLTGLGVGLGVLTSSESSSSLTNSTSKLVPSALEMVTSQGSLTTPATSPKMQKITLKLPESALSLNSSKVVWNTCAPSMTAWVLLQSGHGWINRKSNRTSDIVLTSPEEESRIRLCSRSRSCFLPNKSLSDPLLTGTPPILIISHSKSSSNALNMVFSKEDASAIIPCDPVLGMGSGRSAAIKCPPIVTSICFGVGMETMIGLGVGLRVGLGVGLGVGRGVGRGVGLRVGNGVFLGFGRQGLIGGGCHLLDQLDLDDFDDFEPLDLLDLLLLLLLLLLEVELCE